MFCCYLIITVVWINVFLSDFLDFSNDIFKLIHGLWIASAGKFECATSMEMPWEMHTIFKLRGDGKISVARLWYIKTCLHL